MNNIVNKPVILFVLIAFLAGCAPAATATPIPTLPTYWPANEWRSAAPEEQGMDSETLAQMVDHIQKEKLALHSMLVVRNGYLVNELYVYPYSAEQPHWVASVTKSVIGALVGIAIQQGYLEDIHQTLVSLLPDREIANRDDQKEAITLENLLTHTSGLDCHENPAPGEVFMEGSEDWVQFMLDQPMVAPPGTKFTYCSGAVHLLSAVLQQATGMSTRDYANQNLFAPLGIEPISEARWPSDPQGLTLGGYGLTLTPGEMAKLGYLFLHQGQWDGKTIVPADWAATSIASHANQEDKKEYGYLWWIDPQGKWYAALGRAGEHIFVYPDENLLVVFTAGLPYTNDADLLPLQELLDQYVLPAVKSAGPLPANPDGLARLKAGTQALAQSQTAAPPALPAIAAEISGKTYALEENPFGWQTIRFDFQDGAGEAKITVNDTAQLVIGMDDLYRVIEGGDNLFPQEIRGRWEGPDTFGVEDITLGQMVEFNYRIQFVEDTVHITQQEKFSGNTVELQGTGD